MSLGRYRRHHTSHRAKPLPAETAPGENPVATPPFTPAIDNPFGHPNDGGPYRDSDGKVVLTAQEYDAVCERHHAVQVTSRRRFAAALAAWMALVGFGVPYMANWRLDHHRWPLGARDFDGSDRHAIASGAHAMPIACVTFTADNVIIARGLFVPAHTVTTVCGDDALHLFQAEPVQNTPIDDILVGGTDSSSRNEPVRQLTVTPLGTSLPPSKKP